MFSEEEGSLFRLSCRWMDIAKNGGDTADKDANYTKPAQATSDPHASSAAAIWKQATRAKPQVMKRKSYHRVSMPPSTSAGLPVKAQSEKPVDKCSGANALGCKALGMIGKIGFISEEQVEPARNRWSVQKDNSPHLKRPRHLRRDVYPQSSPDTIPETSSDSEAIDSLTGYSSGDIGGSSAESNLISPQSTKRLVGKRLYKHFL